LRKPDDQIDAEETVGRKRLIIPDANLWIGAGKKPLPHPIYVTKKIFENQK